MSTTTSHLDLTDRRTIPTTAGVDRHAPVRDRLAGLVAARDRLAAELLHVVIASKGDPVDGLPVQVWLEHAGRLTATEARRLLAVADTLRHLPGVQACLDQGRLSYSQVDAICAAARRLRVARRAELDRAIVGVVDEYMTAHPDELVGRVWGWVDRWVPSRQQRAETAADRDQFLLLQPDLFGGGSLYGQLGTVGFATVAEALDAPLAPPTAADLDDLDDLDDQAGQGCGVADARRAAYARAHGNRLAGNLVGLCEAALAGTGGGRSRPSALVVTTQDALLDGDRTPGWLLTTLSGGRMKASSKLIGQLIDRRGADIRTIVLDDCGQVIGVGRRTHVPPDWLREAIWARDLTDTAPGSHTPVRRCDLDHIVPWDHGGRTDVDNLQAIGRTAHRAKTRRRWHIQRQPDGTTTWTHRPTGLTITRPPTWKHHRPPG